MIASPLADAKQPADNSVACVAGVVACAAQSVHRAPELDKVVITLGLILLVEVQAAPCQPDHWQCNKEAS